MKQIFDPEQIRANRRHARKAMAGHDFLFQKAAERLLDNLADINREFKEILVIGERGAEIVQESLHLSSPRMRGSQEKYAEKTPACAGDTGHQPNIRMYDITDGGGEIPLFKPQECDCIIVLPYLHTVNDVPGFLAAVKSYLKPDGLFLCGFFGGHSLRELRQSIMAAEIEVKGGAAQHIHPMIDHYQFAGLLQRAAFALPVVDYETVTVTYSDLKNLYKDLKNMGEGNALTGHEPLDKSLFPLIEQHYRDHFYDNGFVTTFDIIYGIGWAPHASQQQPAKRGSGQVSLGEVL